jgi:AAHS family 3-hydroxyphenylpropionic acid transporter
MLVGASIPLAVIAALAALSVVGAFTQRGALGTQGV